MEYYRKINYNLYKFVFVNKTYGDNVKCDYYSLEELKNLMGVESLEEQDNVFIQPRKLRLDTKYNIVFYSDEGNLLQEKLTLIGRSSDGNANIFEDGKGKTKIIKLLNLKGIIDENDEINEERADREYDADDDEDDEKRLSDVDGGKSKSKRKYKSKRKSRRKSKRKSK
jgi:hypothetical protein